LIGWFTGVLIITEIYQATRTPKDDEDPEEFSRINYYAGISK
jgi:hypothetical protein